MNTPKRIQRKLTRGWKMPAGVVYVGRPSRWGNPFKLIKKPFFAADGDVLNGWRVVNASDVTISPSYGEHHVALEKLIEVYKHHMKLAVNFLDVSELHGKDLACWCRLCDAHKDGKPLGVECPDCDPCHADVLLKFVNVETAVENW